MQERYHLWDRIWHLAGQASGLGEAGDRLAGRRSRNGRRDTRAAAGIADRVNARTTRMVDVLQVHRYRGPRAACTRAGTLRA